MLSPQHSNNAAQCFSIPIKKQYAERPIFNGGAVGSSFPGKGLQSTQCSTAGTQNCFLRSERLASAKATIMKNNLPLDNPLKTMPQPDEAQRGYGVTRK
ncbi:hypothetical protein [Candidatus Ferrigenium straubiae]|jgi:hypothetical protein|uniref:hypothetical protein n=1 Tax=Candidatus Ferrigenium straubiae TaxID=2919506 RepID=UPI003F4A9B17